MAEICVVLPTYNEKENIEAVLSRIFEVVPEASVLVVDDNSPDGTAGLVSNLQKKYKNLLLKNRPGKEGLGKAYIDGFKDALSLNRHSHILMMDADLSHDPSHLPEMIKAAEDYDVVVGSRYIGDGRTVGWELWRRVLSRYGNVYAHTVTGMPINDLTGGFNLMRTSVMRRLDFSNFDASGYAFIMELKGNLHRAGATFCEVPIIFRNRTGGESKISSHIISEGIIAPWRIRFKK
jgi:dolichol-phosphate mannosyltransferase